MRWTAAVQVSALDAGDRQPDVAGRPEAGGGARQRLRRRAVPSGTTGSSSRPAMPRCWRSTRRTARSSGGRTSAPRCTARRPSRMGGSSSSPSRTSSTCCRPMTAGKLWSHNGIPETAGLLGGASPAVEGEVVVAPTPRARSVRAARRKRPRRLVGQSRGDPQRQCGLGPRRYPRPAGDRPRPGLRGQPQRPHGGDRSAQRRPGLGAGDSAAATARGWPAIMSSCWPTTTSSSA